VRLLVLYPPALALAELGLEPYGSATLAGDSPHPGACRRGRARLLDPPRSARQAAADLAWLLLRLQRCGPRAESTSRGFASRCLSDTMVAHAYGGRRFRAAAAEGIELR
jgi:hypothetical protein